MNLNNKIKEEVKEQGVWIVYDLEANRKIQDLLVANGFEFRFDPSLKVTLKKQQEEFLKLIDTIIKSNLHSKHHNCLLEELKQKVKGDEK